MGERWACAFGVMGVCWDSDGRVLGKRWVCFESDGRDGGAMGVCWKSDVRVLESDGRVRGECLGTFGILIHLDSFLDPARESPIHHDESDVARVDQKNRGDASARIFIVLIQKSAKPPPS